MSRGISLFALALGATSIACASILGVGGDYTDQAPDSGRASDDEESNARREGGTRDANAKDVLEADTPCTGHICDGVCLAGATCEGCAQTLLCSATRECVSACTACTAAPVECWSCEGPQSRGSCEPTAGAYCYGAAYAHCGCAGGVADCPGASQVCVAQQCLTCGEPGSDGKPCQSKTCDEAKRRCE